MNAPNLPTSGPAYVMSRGQFGMGQERHHEKPGLAEVMAMLAQFGPTAQVGHQIDAEKLRQMQASSAYAQGQGVPNLEALQLQQQGQHQQQIEQHQTDQEARLDQAQQGQTDLHNNANFIEATKLVTDPATQRNPEIMDAIRQRFNLPAAQPDPRLLKHAIPK